MVRGNGRQGTTTDDGRPTTAVESYAVVVRRPSSVVASLPVPHNPRQLCHGQFSYAGVAHRDGAGLSDDNHLVSHGEGSAQLGKLRQKIEVRLGVRFHRYCLHGGLIADIGPDAFT